MVNPNLGSNVLLILPVDNLASATWFLNNFSRKLSLGQHFVTILTPFEPAPYQVNGGKHRSHYSHQANDDAGIYSGDIIPDL